VIRGTVKFMKTTVDSAVEALLPFGEVQSVKKGDILYRQGGPARGLFLVMDGQLESYNVDDDLQTCNIIQTIGPGQLAGIFGLNIESSDDSIRANSDSLICHFHSDLHAQLTSGDHQASCHYITLLHNTLLGQAHLGGRRRVEDQASSPVVDAIIERAVIAQTSLQYWGEEQLDELIGDIADAVNRQAWELADAAITETGMGVVAHRVQKIMLGTMEVAASLQGQPGSGALAIESPSVDTITVPMGVVLGLIPVTNPVETLVFKVLIALKSRNSVVLSCHRKARHVGRRTVQIIREVLARNEVNPDLVQTPDLPASRELTQLLMSHHNVSFILATGGSSMVKSAYRSGTPSIGVGKGNAPVWVCRDAKIARAAEQIVTSKAFDNGVVCGSENNILIDDAVEAEFTEYLIQNGAAVLDKRERAKLIAIAFMDQELDSKWYGKSAQQICQAAGIARGYPIELIVVPQSSADLTSPLVREKLAPIVSLLSVTDEQEALFIARSILAIEGRGHTAIIHSEDKERIETFARAVDVSRVLVNTPGAQGCIGACNGLALSWTLGCGTSGGGSTSDNVSYQHLQNTKRIAHGR